MVQTSWSRLIRFIAAEDGMEHYDYEAELVVILGRTCKDISAEQALDYVLGYTLSNDVTARTRMNEGKQWGLAKSFDGWFPFGPCIVSAHHPEGITDPDNVELGCNINAQQRQSGNTRDMIWKVRETIEQLAMGTTLHKGSLISMGTPPGEGFKRNPPTFLKDGDICHVYGGNGLGSLINPVQAQGSAPKPKI
ncbi:hypothetical protein ACQY0O_002102 [Thecaphora frezii]